MTDGERDALIEKAAEAMVEYDNPGVYERGDVIADWDDYVGAARVALAVFEQAHTPAAHECTWACWVDRYGQDHHTPTDDERARVLAILADMDYNDGGMMRWSSGRPTEQAEKVADRIVRELRRTVQGEPPDAEVSAFMKTFWEYAPPPGAESRVRAALRAAAAVREEGQGR